ncbi:MAG: T9SS type A sorting domain-containing protein [Bacteroidia bacterium]
MVSDKTIINVSNLNNGVYFLQVKTNQSSYTQKIIVQH